MKGFKDSTKTQVVCGPGAKSGAAGAAKQASMFAAHRKGPQGKPFGK